MISVSEFKAILEILPSIIIYILPGYIFLSVLTFLLCRQFKFDSTSMFKSIIYSYIIINSEQLAANIVYKNLKLDIFKPQFIITTAVISVLSAYIIVRILKSESCEWAFDKFNVRRTIHQNIFDDLKDDTNGVWVRAYIYSDKVVYLGMLRLHEHNSSYDESFVVLSNYVSYPYGATDVREECFESEHKDENWVALKVKDINRLEVVYHTESYKIKKS